MQKLAQKRSILNKLREKTNIGGIAAEKFFNPEFERVMESLRQSDNKIRAIASGTDIEGEDPGADSTSLKDLLKSAKSNINRREYMTALAFLGRFHKKFENISKVIRQLSFDVDKVHNDFLFKDLDEDQKKHLHEMKSRFASSESKLVSEAGIMDFFANVGTERGRALAAWEKRYPRQVKEIKRDITNLYGKSENVLSHILNGLKAMASARATRKIDDYMAIANKIASQFENYDTQFKTYYSGNIKSFLEKQELISPVKKVDDAEKLNDQDIDVEVGSTIPPSSSEPVFPLVQKNTQPPMGQREPTAEENIYDKVMTPGAISSPISPTLPSVDLSAPKTEVDLDAPDTIKEEAHPEVPPPKAAYKKFMDSLVVMADEKPELLAAHISKYARSIQVTDTETAIKLLNIAKSIRQG